MKILVVIFFYFFGHFFLSNNLNAHSGRTNTEGCHNEKKTGGYHCHKPKIYSKNNSINENQLNAFNKIEFKKPENVKEEKKWQTFKLDKSKTVVLGFNGEIIWGDMMFLWFQNKNGKCNTVTHTVQFYTATNNPKLKNINEKLIPINIKLDIFHNEKVTTLPALQRYGVVTGQVSPFLLGHRILLTLGQYENDEYIGFLNMITKIKKYDVSIIQDFEPKDFTDVKIKNYKVTDYFDVNNNHWNLSGTREAIIEAQKLCLNFM